MLAYGESPYLEACLRSLKKQTVPSSIRISTSTPNAKLRQLSDKYHVPVVVHSRAKDTDGLEGEARNTGIAQDWNAALFLSQARYVTLAHQDDVYAPAYTEHILQAARKAERRGESPQIIFTDYFELRLADNAGRRYRKVYINHNLTIKRMLLFPLKSPVLRDKPSFKRACLCLGNPICCPAVTYARKRLPDPPFCGNMGSNIDWQLWEQLSRQEGSFVYVAEPLCGHRVHAASATTRLIRNEERAREDVWMLRHFWPAGVARVIENFYQRAEKSNNSLPKSGKSNDPSGR